MTSPSPGRRFTSLEGHRSLRAPRRGSTPVVSVVVASNGDSQRLASCLPAIVDECSRARAEVVVARAANEHDLDAFARSYPSVAFVRGPASASLAQLRALGMREATGDIVVLVEDVVGFDAERLAACVQHSRHDAGATAGQSAREEIDLAACLARYGVTVVTAAGSPAAEFPDDVSAPAPGREQAHGTAHPSGLRRWLSGMGRMFRGAPRS